MDAVIEGRIRNLSQKYLAWSNAVLARTLPEMQMVAAPLLEKTEKELAEAIQDLLGSLSGLSQEIGQRAAATAGEGKKDGES